MATLAQVTRETRLIAKFSAILAVVLVVIYFTTSGAAFIKNTFFPKPPPPPEVTFGKIPVFAFSTSGPTPEKYVINTVSGTLPAIGTDRIVVYKLYQAAPNLGALPSVRNNLSGIGFTSEPTKLSDITYQWTNGSSNVTYNILTNNFDYTSGYLANGAAIPFHALPNDLTVYDTNILNFFKSLAIDTGDLDVNHAKPTFYIINNGTLSQVAKITDAQVIRMDVIQQNVPLGNSQFLLNGRSVSALTMNYPTVTTSPIYFIFAPDGNGGANIVEAHYTHQYIDYSNHSTYPIKSIAQAFDDLQKGKAVISNPGNNTTVDITDAWIGYYIDPHQQYLYPVYVFSGINFTAYVPAIADSAMTSDQ